MAWEIKQFDSEGNVLKSNGDLGYIYGHRTLEALVSCLPDDDQLYDAPAFVAANQKK